MISKKSSQENNFWHGLTRLFYKKTRLLFDRKPCLKLFYLSRVNPCLFFLCFYHAINAKYDEGNRKNLSHVDGERCLEGFLYLLGVFDEEAEGEDVCQAEAEVPTGANLLRHLLVELPHDDKQNGVCDSLVELSWMAWHLVDMLEDKCPGHICYLADYLRVHQVTQSDKAGCGTCGDGDIVEYRPDAQLGLANIHIEGNHQA